MNKVFALILAFTCSFAAPADDQTAQQLLDKLIAAYGGQTLRDADMLAPRTQYVGFNAGQNYSTKRMDANRFDAYLTIDFKNRRKDFRWLRGEMPDHSIRHWHFDGATGYSIDHKRKTIAQDAGMSFASVDRRVMFTSDLAVVKLAARADAEIEHKNSREWRGVVFDVLEVHPSGFPILELFIHPQTGLLQRLDFGPNGANRRSFQYSGHQQTDGLTYAANTYATRGGKAEIVTTAQSISTGSHLESAFTMPEGYAPAPPTLSFDEMTVQEVAEGVFHVGQHWGFSVFVDAGGYYIGVGGYHDISKRFEALLRHTDKNAPLKYQLVTHHHRDHLGGMQELFDMGVQFIVHPDHIQTIRSQIDESVADSRFLDYRNSEVSALRNFRVGYISNSHSEHNLVAYVPSAKLLFTADMYLSRRQEGSPPADADFYAALVSLGFDVETLAAAHSGRLLSFQTLEEAVQGTGSKDRAIPLCPTDWAQCR